MIAPSASPLMRRRPQLLVKLSYFQTGQVSRPHTINSLHALRGINSFSSRSQPPRPFLANVQKSPGILRSLHPRDPSGILRPDVPGTVPLEASRAHDVPETPPVSCDPDVPGPRAPASSRPSIRAQLAFPEQQWTKRGPPGSSPGNFPAVPPLRATFLGRRHAVHNP